jgi:hypothetical protein
VRWPHNTRDGPRPESPEWSTSKTSTCCAGETCTCALFHVGSLGAAHSGSSGKRLSLPSAARRLLWPLSTSCPADRTRSWWERGDGEPSALETRPGPPPRPATPSGFVFSQDSLPRLGGGSPRSSGRITSLYACGAGRRRSAPGSPRAVLLRADVQPEDLRHRRISLLHRQGRPRAEIGRLVDCAALIG